jgi:2'-5' RNA ligase
MKTWDQFLAESAKIKNGRIEHSFSSTQINLPALAADKIIEWGETNVPDEKLFVDPEDPTFGREAEPHVTVLFGLHTNVPDEIREFMAKQKQFEIALDQISLFVDAPKYDVVKIDIHSPELIALNKKLAERFEHTSKYDYKPHCTIAYVVKGSCNKLNGSKDLSGIKVKVKEILFSDKFRDKTKMSLS